MNFKTIFATILQGASNGAVQGLQSQAGPNINWQGVGIVALFGALVGLSQSLGSHPAVVATAAQAAAPAAVRPIG